MSTEKSYQHFKFLLNAKNLGISAVVAASIGGYTLYQHSAVAKDVLQPLQMSALNVTAEATPQTIIGLYKDGIYLGDSVRAGRWGNVQVTAIIENGELTDFKINDYPHSRSMSLRISQVALPDLMEESIKVQNTSVDVVSGATLTSDAFIQSLQSALDDASTGVTATPTLSASGSSI